MVETDQIEKLLDLCFVAKKITETLPSLPKGMKQRHNFVLYEAYKMINRTGSCHVSSIARQLNTSMPSITKLVSELEKMGLLIKQPDPEDKRAVLITLTEKGKQFVQTHMLDFHQQWANNLEGVSKKDIQNAFNTILKFKACMPQSIGPSGKSEWFDLEDKYRSEREEQ